MNEVRKSFYRICNNGLGEKFYEKFLDANPRIRPLFKNTDFTRQKELIVHAIMMLIEYAERARPQGTWRSGVSVSSIVAEG